MKTTEDFLRACELCPRRCRADRAAGQMGACRAGSRAQVYRHAPHHGEEPPVSGTRGSGTVFFSRCTLHCLYCQNFTWSQEGRGDEMSTGRLAEILGQLHARGCHNWNLVSPTPWLPMVREALKGARGAGISLPVVYNTSGYERVEMLEEFRDAADVYLTDLRYSRPETAARASGAADYVDAARAAFRWMWEKAGPLRTDADGIAVSGVICRLLILPGRAEEAVENLEWLAGGFGDRVPVSVMSQYLPLHRAATMPGWSRRIDAGEYEQVRKAVDRLGFTQGWMQDLEEPPDELVGCRMTAGGDSDPAGKLYGEANRGVET